MGRTRRTFTEIAKMQHRDQDLAANHTLKIGGENWTDKLISAHVTYTTDGGGSGMEMEVHGSLEDYVDAPVEFKLGYGDYLVPYFVGRIMAPRDDDVMYKSTASAFGPFKIMADQMLGSNETFVGRSLEWVILNLAQRAQHAPGEIMVVNGRKFNVLPGESFPFDGQMNDVLSSLMEKAEFVGVDQVGGRRLFMPKPRPGSNTRYKTTYTPNEYQAFSIDPKEETSYHKVIVYRNGNANTPVVYAERYVDNTTKFKPPRNRWYVVSDFPGNLTQAKEECYRLTVNLREKEKGFSMTMFFNPDIHLYDGFRAVREKKNARADTLTSTHSCVVDNSIEVEYSPGSPAIMTVSGSSFDIKKEHAVSVEPVREVAVNGAVLTRDTKQDITFDDVSITMDDGTVKF